MKIYYDEFMPFAQEFFSSLGEAIPFKGREVTAEQIIDADALAVRSTTRCNAQLLGDCLNLKFVGTGTAGYNHFDVNYLNSRNIRWGNAAGCNAHSVTDWVTSVLLLLAEEDKIALAGKTLGIVGEGNIGKLVRERAEQLGMEVFSYDPPRADAEPDNHFVDLDRILNCNFISLHAPFVATGKYQNKHLLNAERLSQLSEKQYLLNAARGELVDNSALLALFEQGKQLNVALDVWESEPDILWPLVKYTRFATQHIGGHSIEGKARGTEFVYRQLCAFLNKPESVYLQDLLPARESKPIDFSHQVSQDDLFEQVMAIYDVRVDDKLFREQVISGEKFDYFRKAYPIRRELV